MGISGLLSLLRKSSRECNLAEFRDCVVAVDAFCWLHRGLISCADLVYRHKETDEYINYCLKYITLLEYYAIKPIMVFDGQRLPIKNAKAEMRRQQRFERTKQHKMLRKSGRTAEALQVVRQCISVSQDKVEKLITACRDRGIDCLVSPYEADAQVAYLNIAQYAEFIITEDSDVVMFGGKKGAYLDNIPCKLPRPFGRIRKPLDGFCNRPPSPYKKEYSVLEELNKANIVDNLEDCLVFLSNISSRSNVINITEKTK